MIEVTTRRVVATMTALLLAATPIAGAVAKSQGDLLVRGRGIAVVPDESSSVSPIGGEVAIGNEYTAELDFTYFFTDNFGAEVILATTKHSVAAKGTGLGDLGLGHVWVLPPALTAQYHFRPRQRISLYIGGGLNYTLYYNVDSGPVVEDVDYESGFGVVVQAGVDIAVRENTYVNLDVKKLWLSSEATIDAGAAGMVSADVDIDPWIFGVGIGTTF